MKSPRLLLAGFTLGLLLIISFVLDCRNVRAGGTIDFRNRITGTRVFQMGQDPYHYKWNANEPPELCDPYNNPALPISKVTVTPTLLMLNLPLAPLAYRGAQFMWLTIQWILLLGTGYVWWNLISPLWKRWLWAFAIAGFTYTVAWRHHADRGQAYVLMVFLLSCWLAIIRSEKYKNSVWGGMLVGLLAALRPPLLLILVPYQALRCRKQLLGSLVGLVLFVGMPMLWNASSWKQYQSGMETWSQLYRDGNHNPRPPAQAFPAEIEGVLLDVLGHFGNIPFADTSIFALFRSFGINSVPALPAALFLAGVMSLWFWHSRNKSETSLLIGMAAWTFLIDLFLPAYRNSYTDVMILNLVALLIVYQRDSLTRMLLAAWPLGWAVNAMLPGQKWIINLPTVIMIAVAVVALLKSFDTNSPPSSAVAK